VVLGVLPGWCSSSSLTFSKRWHSRVRLATAPGNSNDPAPTAFARILPICLFTWMKSA
jgi:hypothetical protein